MNTYAANLEQLAKALGVLPQQLRLEARRAWFPSRTARGFCVAQVMAARQCNVKSRRAQQLLTPLSAADRARLFPPPPDPRQAAEAELMKRHDAMARRVAALPSRETELLAAREELAAARNAWLADPDTSEKLDRYVEASIALSTLELQVRDLKCEQKTLNRKD